MQANAIQSVAPLKHTATRASTGDLIRVIAASTAGSALHLRLGISGFLAL